MACVSTTGAATILTWSVENFLCSSENQNEYLQSPTFLVENIYSTNFHMKLFPKGVDENPFSILCLLCAERNVSALDSDSIAADGWFVQNDGSKLRQMSNSFEEISDDRILTCWLRRENLEQFLKDDTLSVGFRIRKTNELLSQQFKCSAYSHIGVDSLEFKWCIDILDDGIWSIQTYNVIKNSKVGRWFPFLTRDAANNFTMKFELDPAADTIPLISICRIFLIDRNGKETVFGFSKMKQETFRTEMVWEFIPVLTWEELSEKKDIYFLNNTLTLKGKIISSNEHVSHEVGLPKKYRNNKNVECSFFSLYAEGVLCDIKLETPTKTFSAHKVVLAAKSPVFKAMFTTDMQEIQENIVKIEDVDETALGCLLMYLYKNEIHFHDWETCIKLYFAADKYEVLALREVCSKYLQYHVTETTACAVLELADLHQDDHLIHFMHVFIEKNVAVFHTDEWRTLEKEKSELAIATLRQVLLK